jgi:hypothetical protein
MHDANGPGGTSQGRRLMLAAILALALMLGWIAYEYSGNVAGLAMIFTSSSQSSRPQGRIHY